MAWLVVLALAPAGASAAARPDLRVSSLAAGSSATAGGTLAATDTVRNAGKAAARRSVLEYVLSADARRGAGDRRLGTRTVVALKAGKRSRGAKSLRVPADTKAGAMFLIACADPARRIRESNERNNCSRPVALSIQGVAVAGPPTPPPVVTPVATPTATATAAPTVAPTATPTATPTPCTPGPVALRLLGLSGFEGAVDPTLINNVNYGGAAALATYLKNERAANSAALVLESGNGWGASSALSSQFDDQPAVKALNLMGLDVDTFGSHNFDKGLAYAQPLVNLATFAFTARNLNTAGQLSGVAPYVIRTVGGVKVAVIGIVDPAMPSRLQPGRLGAMTIGEPIGAASQARAAAQAEGAQVFVVVTGMGFTGVDVGNNPTGPLTEFAKGLAGFHVIVGGLTDREGQTTINGALIVQPRKRGVGFARITLDADPCTGAVSAPAASFVSVLTSAVTGDQAVIDMLQPYRDQLTAKFSVKIGVANDVFPRTGASPGGERTNETALGNLVAESMRERYGTQLALINGGSIRTALPSPFVPSDVTLDRTSPAPYDLVVGDAFNVLPFGNRLVTQTISGAALWDALNSGVSSYPSSQGKFPQIAGFKFEWSASAAPGARVTKVTVLDGSVLGHDVLQNDPTLYTLTTTNFVGAGGDGYTMLNNGTGSEREVDADVLAAHIAARSSIAPIIDGRNLRNP